ncbi:MAG: DNA polymerase III subunit delta [Bacteroidetes bacterium]|jgi:DNA polymerase III subunit delta'|nr:DNA polymerase III subunit delta [Bacteroidota bacterium]MBT6686630.1 DNA polymerase III subunit delta [Bacteroidota bacterium]MBT7143318.1 DNA polymerase III subunit delta [Bacteroidota bacterium]MBT7493416.1 DNA polymerase III subunit delta [Bacteroidota bacterium]
MQFKEIIGQESIKNRLIRSVEENRVSHSQLFFGPEGSGKLALAVAFAQYISCTNRTENDSCGLCLSCRKFQKLVHPDLHFAFPIFKKKANDEPVCNDFIKEWREIFIENPYFSLNNWYKKIKIENKQGVIYKKEGNEIIRKLNFKAFESEYKIMIIWLPEKMQNTSVGLLLKIIEEPPPKTLFVLVSENTDQIIKTILSRTQLIKIPKIDDSSLLQKLKSKFEVDENKLSNILHLANGNYTKALSLFEENEENKFNLEQFIALFRMCYTKEMLKIDSWVDEIASIGREKQLSFLKYSLKMIRENFILNFNKPKINYLTNEENDFSAKFSPFINNDNISEINDQINNTHFHIERNGNAKIIFFDLAVQLAILIKK